MVSTSVRYFVSLSFNASSQEYRPSSSFIRLPEEVIFFMLLNPRVVPTLQSVLLPSFSRLYGIPWSYRTGLYHGIIPGQQGPASVPAASSPLLPLRPQFATIFP